MRPYDDKHGMIHWDIPYADGTLIAEGYDKDGNLQATYTIQTSGRPYSLRATLIETQTQPRESIEQATYQILVEVLDENGVLVKLADNMISCQVQGGQLLGLENNDNSDMSHPKARQRRVFQGYLVAYVQGQDKAPITVTFSTPLLEETTLTIQ